MGGKKEQVQEISPLESTLVKLLTRGDAELDQDLLKVKNSIVEYLDLVIIITLTKCSNVVGQDGSKKGQ